MDPIKQPLDRLVEVCLAVRHKSPVHSDRRAPRPAETIWRIDCILPALGLWYYVRPGTRRPVYSSRRKNTANFDPFYPHLGEPFISVGFRRTRQKPSSSHRMRKARRPMTAVGKAEASCQWLRVGEPGFDYQSMNPRQSLPGDKLKAEENNAERRFGPKNGN